MHHSLSTGSTMPHQRSTPSSSTAMTAAPCPRRNSSNSGHHHGSASSNSNHLAAKQRLLPTPSSTATTTSTSNSGNNSKSALSAIFWFVLGVCCTCTVFQQWPVWAQCDLFGSSPTMTLTSSLNMASHDATELLDLAMIAANTNGHSQKSSARSDSRRRAPRQQPGGALVLTRERKELYRYAAPKARPQSALASVSSECGSAPDYTAYFAQPPRLRRSLHNEDQTVFRHFFQGQDTRGGFRYIELGAFNGVTESHSRFYDECLGWEGLLIEANPRVYDDLVQNRPYAHRYSFAASCSLQDESVNATVSFWSSIYTNAVQDNVENRRAYADKAPGDVISPPKVDVPCGSLTPVVLDAFPDGRVHFLSLDVEGAEPGVIANLDFERVFVDLLIVESSNQFCTATCPSRNQTRTILQSQGYLLFPDVVKRSDLFVHPSSDLVQAFLRQQKLYNSQQIQWARERATQSSPLPPKPRPSRDATESSARSELATTSTTDTAPSTKVTVTTRWSKYQHRPPAARTVSNFNRRDKVCGTMPGFAEYWNLDMTLRSRENEDKSIYYTFFRQLSRENMKHYRYVELGAFDGVQESNSRFFDLCLGWEGLLIEPNPRIYPDLIRNRPHAHRMSFAASCSEADAAADKTVGFWASAFTNAAQDESVNRGAYANKTKLLQQVPCGSLTPVLLDLFPDGKIHFFSLDTEGTEDKVLANIDFNRISIGALISENRNKFCLETCAARENTRALMKSLGYKLYAETIPFSDLFVHPQSEFAYMVAEEA